ncbi:group-specific protein [Terribacillus sp. JSM ZJ617]|uniref:group-specific protein n=1 Tax=Terribacillus sp. JSM ZJ617 TaxID=3342119 RepID=UPI0035A8DE94
MSDDFINVQLSSKELHKLVMDEIKKYISALESDLVYWDSKDLCEKTRMSWKFIQEQFFFDEAFPKFKVGSKWYYPAKETRDFLEDWLQKQRRH